MDFPISPGDFFDLRTVLTQFDGIAGLNTFRPTIGGDGQGDSEQVVGAGATTNLFTLLGHRIHIGRNFVEEDGTPQAAPPQGDAVPAPGAPPPPLPNIAILSYEFWQRRYGGDESIVGKSIEFGNGRADIVGVLAPGFELLFPPGTNVDPHPDIIVANRVNYETGSRNNVFLRVIAKLKPGVSFEQAQSELDRLSADLARAVSRSSRRPTRTSGSSRCTQDLVADVRPQLVALMGAVVFVLLIACANVANLLLVRASARERELAVRAAIGGNRWRIVRQLVAESVVLAAIGGAAGLLLAQFGIDALIQLSPEGLPRATAVSLDGTVLAFTAIASFAAALDLRRAAGVAGVAPRRDRRAALERPAGRRRVGPLAARRRGHR